MRSIRLSLVAYFLVLLALGLGAFGFFMYESSRERLAGIYRTNEATLTEQNRHTQALLEERYQLTEQTLKANFDEKLVGKAQSLANHLARQGRSYWDWDNNVRPNVRAAAGMTTQLQVIAAPGAPLWLLNYQAGEFCRREASAQLWRNRSLTAADLQFIEEVIPTAVGIQASGYFQIYNDRGDSLHASASLGLERLKLSEADRQLQALQWHFKDIVLAGNKPARLVTLKVPVVRTTWRQVDTRPRGSAPPRRPRVMLSATEPADNQREAPIVFIQYARPRAEVDDTLAELRADLTRTRETLQRDLQETLTELDRQSQASLATLRTRLLISSLATFIATVLGGVWLVHRVLKPVQRISQAVSQVSERDFQLKLNAREVPEELSPIVERLEQALQSLGGAFAREKQAAADISHELRTPISALLATAQVCLRKARTPEEYRLALQNCHDIGQQLNTLVERLLTLARLDAGADKLRPELVDVPELAEQCVEMVRALAESRELSLHLERNGPVVLQTDPDKLREVLINLLHNAIQYNRPKGRIDVAVGRNNGQVELSVRDTGIGIAPDAKVHLFERFYRVDPSRQSDTVQAGLGLAIVKGYLELMGGSIDVESTAGVGSTFRVSLPAASVEA